MRGPFDDQGQLFSYISPERRVPTQHPLRTIRELVREVFRDLDHDFRILYSTTGRPSIPPEQLLSALLLQVFYGVRSERQLMEHLDYNLLYRWFVGLASDDAVCDATTFTKNRERLQQGDLFNRFMETLLHHQADQPPINQAGSEVKIPTGEKEGGMARKRYTAEEIIGQLRTIEIELDKVTCPL
jgi:transposase